MNRAITQKKNWLWHQCKEGNYTIHAYHIENGEDANALYIYVELLRDQSVHVQMQKYNRNLSVKNYKGEERVKRDKENKKVSVTI